MNYSITLRDEMTHCQSRYTGYWMMLKTFESKDDAKKGGMFLALYSAPLSCDVTQHSDQAMSDAFLADTADHSPQEEARGGDTAQWASLGNQPD